MSCRSGKARAGAGLKTLLALTVATGALLLAATPGSVHAGDPARSPLLGVVPHAGASVHPASALGRAAHGGPLVYHYGETLRTNTTYAIYWVPSGYEVSSSYVSLINRYFTDVAAASGSSSNVYSTDTQYYDSSGPIAYQSTFGGSAVATNAFPAGGCKDGSDPVCLTDQQLQDEITNVIATQHWSVSDTSVFFIMTPDAVGVCYDSRPPSAGGVCTTNVFCAYHDSFVSGAQQVIYAVAPYDPTVNGCSSDVRPNGDDADVTINAISHEHNEAITDPTVAGWFADDGHADEMADLCAGAFGSPLGTVAGQPYNQVINGDHYWLQEEYSNDGHRCVQRYAASRAPANTKLPTVNGAPAVGKALATTDGAWAPTPAGITYGWLRCGAGGGSCAPIAGATTSTYVVTAADRGHTIRSSVTASNTVGSATAVSAPSGLVVTVPALAKEPQVSGKARVARTLSVNTGAWHQSPARFRYQWLRCNATGASCRPIAGATKPHYRLTKHDAGHRLRVRVTALNAAGGLTALSTASGVVEGG